MSDPTKDFLGDGWKFPPRLNSRGQIELINQEQDVAEALKIILMTRKGERAMRPEFGSELFTLQFAPNDSTTAGLARRYTTEALEVCEPRIDVVDVLAGPDPEHPERLLIEVHYKIHATNADRNLVFPFYVIPDEE